MKNRQFAIAILCVLVGFMAHIAYISLYGDVSNSKSVQIRENSSRFNYINPLLYIDNSNEIYKYLDPLNDSLNKHVRDQISKNEVERVSVYFRDLNTGSWTGVKPDDKFVPASMLKVLIMMTYLKILEDDPNILNKKVVYTVDPNERQNYPPTNFLENGKYYSVSELIGQSIIQSDNFANTALRLPIENKVLELFKILRLPQPLTESANFMSPRDVSIIFRSMYSSTYLSDSYSEQALELLTQTRFDKGIRQGVDSNIKVAHKFGEHTIYFVKSEQPPKYQLHDCGIVYYPKKPYFICVMTEGKKLSDLEKAISDISATTFSFVKGGNI